MRGFYGFREQPPKRYQEGGFANPPADAQYHGVEFDDGTVAVRWLTKYRSVSFWNSFKEFEIVHGHTDYDTKIIWYYMRREEVFD